MRLALLFAATLGLPLAALANEAGPDPAAAPAAITGDNAQLRCAAAFAIIASEQQRAAPGADALPPLGEAGREYFVQVMAARIDAEGLDDAAITALAQAQAQQIQREAGAAADPAAYTRQLAAGCLPQLALLFSPEE